MGQKWSKIAIFGDFEHFGTPQSCPEGKDLQDPPKHLRIEDFYKNRQIGSPDAYFIDLCRFIKVLCPPDPPFMNLYLSVRIKFRAMYYDTINTHIF